MGIQNLEDSPCVPWQRIGPYYKNTEYRWKGSKLASSIVCQEKEYTSQIQGNSKTSQLWNTKCMKNQWVCAKKKYKNESDLSLNTGTREQRIMEPKNFMFI